MSQISTAKPTASPFINAVCTAVEDMGVIETKFGKKPMLKFTFETEEVNEFGQKRRLTRLFHKHTHPMSSASIAAKAWCNRDLAAEEDNIGEVDWQSFVDSSARLKLEPGQVKDGKCFANIVEILPPNDEETESTCQQQETK